MHRKNLSRRRGFTLIELLVVVMIIGILATLAFPRFRSVLDRTEGQAAEQAGHGLARLAHALSAFDPDNTTAMDGIAAAEPTTPAWCNPGQAACADDGFTAEFASDVASNVCVIAGTYVAGSTAADFTPDTTGTGDHIMVVTRGHYAIVDLTSAVGAYSSDTDLVETGELGAGAPNEANPTPAIAAGSGNNTCGV